MVFFLLFIQAQSFNFMKSLSDHDAAAECTFVQLKPLSLLYCFAQSYGVICQSLLNKNVSLNYTICANYKVIKRFIFYDLV